MIGLGNEDKMMLFPKQMRSFRCLSDLSVGVVESYL